MKQIDQLIINNPYEMPKSYWRYDREQRQFIHENGRRPAGYLVALTKDADDPGEFHELPLVNQIRKRVDSWRENNYPGVTGITKRLLEFWNNPEIRDYRFFFCQIEAIETLIWLIESPENEKQGIIIPSDGGQFQRLCSKMATGSGKTIVMGMLIAWQVLNKITYPTDTRFSKTILVISPGLTVKKRLKVLQPSDENNIYQQFNMIPDSLYDKLRRAKIIIHNWHMLMPIKDAKRSVVKKGYESTEAFSKRIIGDSSKNIIIINDEAHHAWRIKSDQKPDVGKEEIEETKIWLEGLDTINSARNILRCFDFTATPFVPSGRNVTEDYLFDWIISDFSLNDAIESGLVKTPRIAVRDDSGRFDKNFRSRLYHIYTDSEVKSDLKRKAKPEEPLPDLLRGAYYLLGKDWQATKKEWEENGSLVPPVMITVCNRTETAARIKYAFENKKFEDLDDLSDPSKILHIDSKVLKEAEVKDSPEEESIQIEDNNIEDNNIEDQTLEQRAERLREIVDTVGKEGKAGQHIQNIIAVSMLSEGWDARTVTQIMGLRAFSSQLLCEQVVGRGLRRSSYEIDEGTQLFTAEYVNIFGVPFSFLPHEGTTDTPPPPTTPRTRVEPDPNKIQFQISWPNVLKIERTYYPILTIDWNKVQTLQIRPEVAKIVEMAQVIDGKPATDKTTDIDLEKLGMNLRTQTLIFKTAKEVFELFKPEWKGNKVYLLFQLVKIVEEFIKSQKIKVINVLEDDELKKRLTIVLNMNKIVQHVFNEIKPLNTEKRKLVLNEEKKISSTSDMSPWYTKKKNERTKRSHVSHAVHDSSWEANVTFELDRNDNVVAWVKNDHLPFKIPYIFGGVFRDFYPDYIIRLQNGITLVLEVKGIDSQEQKTKREALDEWIKAVNEDGNFGTWAWDVTFDPTAIKPIIAKHSNLQLEPKLSSKCPLCSKTANNRQEVRELFGFRNMDGILRPQSWCRSCRKTALQKHKLVLLESEEILDITKSTDKGFVIDTNKMKNNQTYWFEYEESTYEIKKNEKNELEISEVK